jgi:hypothetical protein
MFNLFFFFKKETQHMSLLYTSLLRTGQDDFTGTAACCISIDALNMTTIDSSSLRQDLSPFKFHKIYIYIYI